MQLCKRVYGFACLQHHGRKCGSGQLCAPSLEPKIFVLNKDVASKRRSATKALCWVQTGGCSTDETNEWLPISVSFCNYLPQITGKLTNHSPSLRSENRKLRPKPSCKKHPLRRFKCICSIPRCAVFVVSHTTKYHLSHGLRLLTHEALCGTKVFQWNIIGNHSSDFCWSTL